MVKNEIIPADKKELETLLQLKASAEKNLEEINRKIAWIRWGNGPAYIDLELEILKILYELAYSGYQTLEDNWFRDSEFEDCTYELFWNRILPPSPPMSIDQIEVKMFKNAITGVISLPGTTGIAAIGTIIHQYLQGKLRDKFGDNIIKAEEEISHQFDIEGFKIKITGHVDLRSPANGFMKLADFKTMKHDNFLRVVGLMPCSEISYPALKRSMATGQGNAYAMQLGHEGKTFVILWISQQDFSLKREEFPVSKEDYTAGLVRILDVVLAIKRYRAGEKSARPKPGGVMKCSMCRHFKIHCLGKDAVLGGQKTLDVLVETKK